MAGSITVYMPYAESKTVGVKISPRLDTLAGKTIGLVNNGWRSLDVTYKEFHKLLREKFEVADVIETRKLGTSMPLPEEALKELVAKADGVIVGLGT